MRKRQKRSSAQSLKAAASPLATLHRSTLSKSPTKRTRSLDTSQVNSNDEHSIKSIQRKRKRQELSTIQSHSTQSTRSLRSQLPNDDGADAEGEWSESDLDSDHSIESIGNIPHFITTLY